MSQFTYVTMLHEHCTATLYQHRLSLGPELSTIESSYR